jgi:hypothetical protein
MEKRLGCVSNELNRPKKREGWGMYIPHPSLFFGEPPTEMKCTQTIFTAKAAKNAKRLKQNSRMSPGVLKK